MFAVFGEFDGMVGIAFVLQEALVAFVPPDDLALGITGSGAGANLLHGIRLVLEGDAGRLLPNGDVYRKPAIAGIRKLSWHRHAVRLGLSGLAGRALRG